MKLGSYPQNRRRILNKTAKFRQKKTTETGVTFISAVNIWTEFVQRRYYTVRMGITLFLEIS